MYREIMWYEGASMLILIYGAISLIFLAIVVSIDASKRENNPATWFIFVLIFNFIGALAYLVIRGSRKNIDITIVHYESLKTIQTSYISIFNDLRRELDRLYPNEKALQSNEYYYITTDEKALQSNEYYYITPEVKEKARIAATLDNDILKITVKNDEFEKILESVKCLIRDVKNPNYIHIKYT